MAALGRVPALKPTQVISLKEDIQAGSPKLHPETVHFLGVSTDVSEDSRQVYQSHNSWYTHTLLVVLHSWEDQLLREPWSEQKGTVLPQGASV